METYNGELKQDKSKTHKGKVPEGYKRNQFGKIVPKGRKSKAPDGYKGTNEHQE